MNSPTNIQDEVGATDNRLSLSVGDHEEIQDWQDGNRYRITLIVVQQTPGEFNVESVESSEEAEPGAEVAQAPEETEGPETEAEAMPMMAGRKYPNPAVERMMSGRRA